MKSNRRWATINMLTEEFLVDHYEKNFNKLVKRYSSRFDNATVGQDVVQEAYYRVWLYREAYNPAQPFENWFGVICYNAFCTAKAEERGHATAELDEFDVEGQVDDVEFRLMMNQVKAEIYKEPEWKHEILELFFVKGYPVADIVKLSPRTYGSISMCVKEFRKKMKKLIE